MSETEDDEFDMCEEESNGSLGQIVDEMEEEDKELQELQRQVSDIMEGDWALVQFPGKKSVKYYVGLVLPEDNDTEYDELRMKFTRKTIFNQNLVFKFPPIDDISHVQKNDIIKLLPQPKICKRGQIRFDVSFEGYSVQ